MTDDRGNYRLSGIEPGSYYISAADSRAYVNPPSIEAPHSYFPGVALPSDASPISIGAAAVPVRVADFTFAPAEGGTIRGRVFDASGRPDSEADVIVHASGAGGELKPPPRRARADANGTFVVPHVPPGDYAVADGWGRVPFQRVTVRSGRETVMTLREVPAAAVHGQVTFDGDATGRRFWYALASYPANLDTASGTQAGDELGGFTLKDDGTFRISRLLGELRLTSLDLTSLPAGWWLKSAIVDCIDVSETPFRFRSGATYSGARIVLSQTAATVSGRVRTPNGDPATQGSALIVPTDSRKWYPGSRYVRAATLAGETFSLAGLPPGDYWVAAIPGEFTTSSWAISVSEPGGEAFLWRATRGARKVTLSPGQNATVDLVLRTTR